MSDIERIKNVAAIIRRFPQKEILIVISALGKTTNALEEVVADFFNRNKDAALEKFAAVKNKHRDISAGLLGEAEAAGLDDLFTEVEWLLHDNPVRGYDYYYDQIVCVGELLSSTIVSRYLQQCGIKNNWIDVRDILRTDNNFRDARVDWDVTAEKVQNHIVPLFSEHPLVITQGFIGSTDENESTTLGREGSDYTAAVFANLLNAESVTIWKDVPGVMNADPKTYEKATLISELNYREVIEMAYYGAQVIHPKTIKPLQNKHIPLYVRSFVDPGAEGTVIHNDMKDELPPIIVYKNNQALIRLSSRDFSFVGEELTATMHRIFASLKYKPNMTQNAAISLMYVADDKPEKLKQLEKQASDLFDVSIEHHLCLLTIRHFRDDLVTELVTGKKVLLTQRTPETIQVLMEA